MAVFGWHYLLKATSLIRPRLFYALFVVSRITPSCHFSPHARARNIRPAQLRLPMNQAVGNGPS